MMHTNDAHINFYAKLDLYNCLKKQQILQSYFGKTITEKYLTSTYCSEIIRDLSLQHQRNYSYYELKEF